MAPLLAAMFGGFLAVGLPLPALPLFVADRLALGTALAGLAVGIQSLATVLTRLPAGRMVDMRGARTTLIRGLAVAALSGGLTLFAATLRGTPHWSLGVLLAGRLLLGIGESLLITGVLSWAMERAGPGRSGRAMAWNGMAQYGALAGGAPAGFWLFRTGGMEAVALVAALAPLLALLVVLPLHAGPTRAAAARVPVRDVLRHVWRPGIGLFLAGIGFAAVGAFASLLFTRRDWPGAGLALFCYGACFVGVRVVGSAWPDRFGGRLVASGSMAVGAVGQALLWLAPDPAIALSGAALTGAGCSLVFPALGVEAFRPVPADRRGVAVGAFAAFQDLAFGSTGPLLGLLASAGPGPSAPFAVGAAAAAAGSLLSLTLGGLTATAAGPRAGSRSR